MENMIEEITTQDADAYWFERFGIIMWQEDEAEKKRLYDLYEKQTGNKIDYDYYNWDWED